MGQHLRNAVNVAAGTGSRKRKPDTIVPVPRCELMAMRVCPGSNFRDCSSSKLDGNPKVLKSNVFKAA
jgi:hypothetical protein